MNMNNAIQLHYKLYLTDDNIFYLKRFNQRPWIQLKIVRNIPNKGNNTLPNVLHYIVCVIKNQIHFNNYPEMGFLSCINIVIYWPNLSLDGNYIRKELKYNPI